MGSNTTMPNPVRGAQQTARNAANSGVMRGLARVGYAAKGAVYIIIGFLAAKLAFGQGGQATDQRGALRTIAEQPFGKILLIIIAIGLLAFGLWSLIQAIFDTEGEGRQAKGIVARVGYAVVGIAYLVLAFGAYQLAAGTGTGGKSTTSTTQDATAKLLALPFGVPLVIIVGLVVLGIAVYLYARAWRAKFQRKLALSNLRPPVRKTMITLGRLGYAALGVVFTIIGFFLIVAAVRFDPHKAKGLDSAIGELQKLPFGQLLLALVALGLLAYGVYSFIEARYRILGAA
jgi:uncharacterized protein DUF1206